MYKCVYISHKYLYLAVKSPPGIKPWGHSQSLPSGFQTSMESGHAATANASLVRVVRLVE